MSNPVDKLIEEWLAQNEGEELPGTGQPLNLDEYFSWPEDQRIGLLCSKIPAASLWKLNNSKRSSG